MEWGNTEWASEDWYLCGILLRSCTSHSRATSSNVIQKPVVKYLSILYIVVSSETISAHIAVMKYKDQKKVEKERLYFAYISKS